jgi:hypothetical protein
VSDGTWLPGGRGTGTNEMGGNMRKLLLGIAVVTLPVGIVASTASVAAARGGPKPPVAALGTTTCNIHGELVLNSNGSLSLRGNLTPHHGPACSSTGGSRLHTGHMNQTLPTSAPSSTTDLCPAVTAATSSPQPLADLAGGDIAWSPTSKVAGSVGVGLTGGTLSVSGTNLVVTYLASSVASGSFTGSGSGFTASTSLAAVQAACASGPVTTLHLLGTLSL